MKKTQIAGAVVLSDKGNILIVNQNGNSWSLPKGHVEPGETTEQTAVRETYEEAGISGLHLVKQLGSYERYKIGKNEEDDKSELKHITMYLFHAKEVEPHPHDPTNPEARWLNPSDVAETLTHSKDKEYFLSIKQMIA